MDSRKLLKSIKKVVYECGKIIVSADRDSLDIELKEGNNNVVTNYDKLVQDTLKEKLTKLIPGSVFFGEENNESVSDISTLENVFIVDPIDGTTNFSRGFKTSSISVCLVKNNQPVIGVCYNPYTDEMYSAIKGEGSYLNDKKIHVSNRSLKDGILLSGCSPYYDDLRRKSIEIHSKFCSVASDFRRFGSAVFEICSIASGRAEVYFELKLMPWDYAAASLILDEAGGKISTIHGDALQYNNPTSVLASNGVEDYLEYIK